LNTRLRGDSLLRTIIEIERKWKEESNRKTKTDDAGLDGEIHVRLWKAERRDPATRGVAMSYRGGSRALAWKKIMSWRFRGGVPIEVQGQSPWSGGQRDEVPVTLTTFSYGD